MARVRFTEDFDYWPRRGVVVAYLAGMVEVVKRDCARQAIAAGKAVEMTGSKRGQAHGDQQDGGKPDA